MEQKQLKMITAETLEFGRHTQYQDIGRDRSTVVKIDADFGFHFHQATF